MSSVAVITARGGSKRIPRKNILDFAGKPIIAYSIEAALQAGCFDEVMVSTDDSEIADIAVRYGAVVPFLRSAQNSDDNATTLEVLKEVVTQYRKSGQLFDMICCLYPTAPFVNSEKIRSGHALLLQNPQADVAVPVVAFSYPILRAMEIKEGYLSMIHPEYRRVRSQDLPPAYHDIGQYYWLRSDFLFRADALLEGNLLPIITPESEVQDIDTMEDWNMAELKFEILQNRHDVSAVDGFVKKNERFRNCKRR